MNRENSIRIFGNCNCLTAIFVWSVILFPFLNLTAQTNLTWNKTIGGNGYEELQTMIETPDGNFVFFGSHTSDATGEITQGSRGLSDYWLAKVDQTNGNIIWQNTYGGDLIDNARMMVPTSDGGYLLGGHSSTGINGTKTEISVGSCWNCIDFWVVKTDANGNQLWDRTIEGNDSGDRLTSLVETSDGGFVMAGYSESGIGTDKSEANIGGSDYWVVKLDSVGNQLWDRTLGGTGDEQPEAIVELPNGTILVGGLSFSLNGGNRTALSRGLADYWVVNLDVDGTILWDKAYGGLNTDNLRDMILTQDDGIILIGESYSGISGEKTGPNIGERDIWMVKTDLAGNVLWDRTLGGTDRDQAFKITQSPNGNFLIASLSKSPAGVDRSEPALGGADYWFITTDANGNKIKDRIFGGDQNDNLYYALPMKNGDIILGGITATDTSPQKTEPSRGNNDIWLLKYESTLDFSLGNDTIFCVDSSFNLDATINPCDCCVYTWEDGSTVSNRNLQIDQDTTLILAVKDGFNSYILDTINIQATPEIIVDLGLDSYLCEGDSISLNAGNPGENYSWFPTNTNDQELIVTNGDLYQVTVTDQFGCTNGDEVLITEIALTTTINDPIICEGDSLFLANAWQNSSGMYLDTLDNFAGCDSIIMTNLFVANMDTTRFFETTCDLTQAGIFSMTVDNQFLCDSIIINTITYVAPDTTLLFETTCDEMQAGIFSSTIDNQFSCDSTIINTITYIAPDTTLLFDTTCDETQAGVFSSTIDNQYSCDSTIVNTITYIAPDTTLLFETTCDETQAGIFSTTMDNQFSCDSTVISTITYIASDTTRFFETTCDETEAGIFSTTLDNQFSCDSTIISTISYIAPDTTRFFETTCDPAQAGVFTSTITGQSFCDSIVINTITFIPPDVINLTEFTCDENQAGLETSQDLNVFGCDSTTMINFIYVEPDTTELTGFTCDPDQAGLQIVVNTNYQGCDSVVITNNSFTPTIFDSDFLFTCDSSQAGTFIDTLASHVGCDSLVMTTTFEYIPAETTNIVSVTCDSTLARTIVENLNGYRGCDSTVVTEIIYFQPTVVNIMLETCDPDQADLVTTSLLNGAGCDSLITITETIYRGSENTDLSLIVCDSDLVGVETTTFTNQFGCDSIVILTTELLPTDTTTLNFISCDPDSLGVETEILSNQNGCDSVILLVTSLEDLEVDFEVTDATCFNTPDGSILVNSVFGGVSPHVFAIDEGSFQSFALFPRLSGGTHTLWVQDADGCTVPYEFEIQTPPPLVVSLPRDTTINIGSILTLSVTLNQSVDTIFWNEVSGINCDSLSCLNPTIQPLDNSTYIVSIANGDGCMASDTMEVSVSKDRPFFIPNAFSPNGDGINDNFVLSPGPNTAMIHSIRIYNRWGALILELPETLPNQSIIGWDGTFKGEKVTSGVYIFTVDVSFVDGERTILSGDVTVIR